MLPILAMLLQAAAAPTPWAVTTLPSTDPTVTTTTTVAVSADGNARLRLRCDAGAQKIVSVQLFTRDPLGGPPNRNVDLSVDGKSPITYAWEFSVPPQKGAFTRSDAEVTALTTAIAGAKSIKVHTVNFTGEPVDATFAGPPSAAPVKAVLSACGYTLGEAPVREPVKK